MADQRGFIAFARNADSVEARRAQQKALHLALEQKNSGKLSLAIQTLADAVAISPNSVEVPLLLLHRGYFLALHEQSDDALTLADQCIQVFPTRGEGYYLRACIYCHSDMIHEAIQSFKVAQSIDKELGETNMMLKESLSELATKVAQYRQQRIKDAFTRHAENFSIYENCKCKRCSAEYTTPTPQWLCTRCWVQDGKEVTVWQPDDSSKQCHHCGSELGFTNRHHCRCCGRLFCGNCTPKKMELALLKYTSPVRVCVTCETGLRVQRGAIPPLDASGDPYTTASMVVEDP
jgi:tetratricopeptide (TPR) repeat protein